jgi:hypothetical protein
MVIRHRSSSKREAGPMNGQPEMAALKRQATRGHIEPAFPDEATILSALATVLG